MPYSSWIFSVLSAEGGMNGQTTYMTAELQFYVGQYVQSVHNGSGVFVQRVSGLKRRIVEVTACV
jgi:hypothetical protein